MVRKKTALIPIVCAQNFTELKVSGRHTAVQHSSLVFVRSTRLWSSGCCVRLPAGPKPPTTSARAVGCSPGCCSWLREGQLRMWLSRRSHFHSYYDVTVHDYRMYCPFKCMHFVPLRHVDQHLLGAVIDLLHVLWFANLGQRDKHVDGTSSSSSKEDKPQSFKCLPLPLINEFLCVTSSIMRHLR